VVGADAEADEAGVQAARLMETREKRASSIGSNRVDRAMLDIVCALLYSLESLAERRWRRRRTVERWGDLYHSSSLYTIAREDAMQGGGHPAPVLVPHWPAPLASAYSIGDLTSSRTSASSDWNELEHQ
jgi:hypothetical protein